MKLRTVFDGVDEFSQRGVSLVRARIDRSNPNEVDKARQFFHVSIIKVRLFTLEGGQRSPRIECSLYALKLIHKLLPIVVVDNKVAR